MQIEDAQTFTRTPRRRLSLRDRWMRALLARLIAKIETGTLTLALPNGETLIGGNGAPAAMLTLHRWRPILRLLLEGDLGFAEAYMEGDWSTPDLHALLTFAAGNQSALSPSTAASWPRKILATFQHRANANTRRGSQRNIRAHYDLGNDFYAAWLDEGMSYSSGLYACAATSLDDAQTAKQDLAIDLMELSPEHDVLEIGCGWGGLMERIAQAGAQITGLTLSPAQFAYTQQRLHQAGLAPQAAPLLQDYRDATGKYDRIVSIEMFEAVGQAYWPLFFQTLQARLKKTGIAVLQVITIDESRFGSYANQADFIQAHIFPGGMLPTKAILAEQAARAGLTLVETRFFGASYAQTLTEWAQRFEQAWPRLREQGFNEAFRRKWRYYLAYCEAGFRVDALDVGMYKFVAS